MRGRLEDGNFLFLWLLAPAGEDSRSTNKQCPLCAATVVLQVDNPWKRKLLNTIHAKRKL